MALLPIKGFSIKSVLCVLPEIIKHNEYMDIWRNYTAECLRVLTENTGGVEIKTKYADLLRVNRKTSSLDVNEIAAHVITKAGLKVIQ